MMRKVYLLILLIITVLIINLLVLEGDSSLGNVDTSPESLVTPSGPLDTSPGPVDAPSGPVVMYPPLKLKPGQNLSHESVQYPNRKPSGPIVQYPHGFRVRMDMPMAVDKNCLYSLTLNNSIVKYNKHNNFTKIISKSTGVSEVIRDFALDDNFLYLIFEKGNLIVYNKTDLNEYAIIKAHSSEVMAIYLTQDLIYTGSWDCSLKVWNKTSLDLVNTFFLNGDYTNENLDECCQINSIAVDKDKIYVACESPYFLIIDKNTETPKTSSIMQGFDKYVLNSRIILSIKAIFNKMLGLHYSWSFKSKNKVYSIKIGDISLSETNPLTPEKTPMHVQSVDFDNEYLYVASDWGLNILNKGNFSLVKKLPVSSVIVKSDKDMVYFNDRSEINFLNKNDFVYSKTEPLFNNQTDSIHNIIFDERNLYSGSMQNKIFIIDKNDKKLRSSFEIS